MFYTAPQPLSPPSSRKVLGTTGLVGKLLMSLFTRHPRALCFTLKLHVSPDDCIAAGVLDGCVLTWATSGTLILLKEPSVHFRFVEIIAAFSCHHFSENTLCLYRTTHSAYRVNASHHQHQRKTRLPRVTYCSLTSRLNNSA